jgi:ankyrin repeat protein
MQTCNILILSSLLFMSIPLAAATTAIQDSTSAESATQSLIEAVKWTMAPAPGQDKRVKQLVAKIPKLVEQGADINAKITVREAWGKEKEKSMTFLMATIWIASRSGRPIDELLIHTLIANGADVNAIDDRGDTALAHAAMVPGGERIVGILLRAKADPNKGQIWKPLVAACFNADTISYSDTIRALLEAGADVNTKFKYGNKWVTALDLAKMSVQSTPSKLKDYAIHTVNLLQERGAKSAADLKEETQF